MQKHLIKIYNQKTNELMMTMENVLDPKRALKAYAFDDYVVAKIELMPAPKQPTIWEKIKRFFGFKR
jgi:hypothetical protein